MSETKMVKVRANVPALGLRPGMVVDVAADPMVLGAIRNGYLSVIEPEAPPVAVEPTTLKSDERVERIARLAGRKPTHTPADE